MNRHVYNYKSTYFWSNFGLGVMKGNALPEANTLLQSTDFHLVVELFPYQGRKQRTKCDQKTLNPWYHINPKEVSGSISVVESLFLFYITITSLCIAWVVNPVTLV